MRRVKKVLVIGNNVRSIACSARKAGYTVYALDRFGDVDMCKCANEAQILEKPGNELQQIAGYFSDTDAIILGPGFENLKLKNALNNSPEIMEQASDKSMLSKKLKSMDIPHPKTESMDKAGYMRFPLMIKPRSGSGGIRNIIVRNEAEMENFRNRSDFHDFIAQEFVEGIPCSTSLICTGDGSAVVALNEQLIGLPWLTRLPFAYCGNITPLHTKFKEEMIRYANQIALEFKLLGSNGVDFMLTDKGVQVIEINPRFQGSLDTVELSTGLNIFNAHIRSFEGELPKVIGHQRFASKTIVFAEKEFVVSREISDMLIKCMNKGRAADIPRIGSIIRPDEPIATMLATARTRMMALDKVRKASQQVKEKSED